MAKKGPMPIFETIDGYISAHPSEAQSLLKELRSIIHEAVPEVEELSDTKTPLFKVVPEAKSNHQIMLAAYEKFISLYLFPGTMAHFADDLEGFVTGKGSVQFPLSEPLPKDLIIRMVRYRKEEILSSTK